MRNGSSVCFAFLVALAVTCSVGCGPGVERLAEDGKGSDGPAPPYFLAVDVFADSARSQRLRIEPPPARIAMSNITPASSLASVPLPSVDIDSVAPPPPAAIEHGTQLVAPILKERAQLFVPARLPRGVRFVELDVRLDEAGAVSHVRWAGGSDDPELVRAASACAQRMRFLPALRGGEPVAVWSRQRFEFGR